jgi:hypothetical protein
VSSFSNHGLHVNNGISFRQKLRDKDPVICYGAIHGIKIISSGHVSIQATRLYTRGENESALHTMRKECDISEIFKHPPSILS